MLQTAGLRFGVSAAPGRVPWKRLPRMHLMKRLLSLAAVLLSTACFTVTGPDRDCHQGVVGKLVGIVHYADGKADTLRADPKVWADTLTKCTTK